LKELRHAQQLSQEELAERAKMSAAAISALERGSRRAPYRTSVDLLADALGIDQEVRTRLHAVAERRRKGRASPAQSRPNNLPFQISSFVGRENELGELQRLIAKSRLLTVVGPGGVGKTRVALQLAQRILGTYADGAWLVDLTGVRKAEFVPNVVAAQLNIREQPNQPIEETITGELAAKQLLLIIDNAEHLLAAVTRISKAILLRSPRVRLVVTSREPIHVAGEQVYRLSALGEPPGAGDETALSQHDSTRLFLERARDADPSIEFNEADCAATVALCRRLQGMPLAIELACARLSSLTLSQLESRLKSSLTLSSKDATEAPRRRTIRNTIAWSYDLLSANEQTALSVLSVFQGGCTAEALRAVAVDIENVDEAVDSLADKSLLHVDESATEERWRLLDAVREFAGEKLQAAEWPESAERRHAAYYAGLVEAADGLDTSTAYSQLDRDLYNIRRALDWSIARDHSTATRLALGLAPYWRTRGTLTEAVSWIARVLACEIEGDNRARLLNVAASFATLRDALPESLQQSREALAIYEYSGNSAGAAEALFRIAEVEHRQGMLDNAEANYRSSYEAFRVAGNARGELLCTGNLGIIARQRGDLKQSSALLQRAIDAAADLNERRIGSEFTIAMGWAQLDLNDIAEAQRLFERGFAQSQQDRNPVVVCSARHGLATVALKEQRLDEALNEFVATLQSARELQLSHYVARGLHGIAAIQAVRGDVKNAARLLALADRLFEESGRRVRDSIAYDVAADAITASMSDSARRVLFAEGAALNIDHALASLLSEK
jgi:predicted ATPase